MNQWTYPFPNSTPSGVGGSFVVTQPRFPSSAGPAQAPPPYPPDLEHTLSGLFRWYSYWCCYHIQLLNGAQWVCCCDPKYWGQGKLPASALSKFVAQLEAFRKRLVEPGVPDGQPTLMWPLFQFKPLCFVVTERYSVTLTFHSDNPFYLVTMVEVVVEDTLTNKRHRNGISSSSSGYSTSSSSNGPAGVFRSPGAGVMAPDRPNRAEGRPRPVVRKKRR